MKESLQPNRSIFSPLTLFVIGFLILVPEYSHAWGGASVFTGKIKSIFLEKENKEEAESPTSQTIALFKPLVVEQGAATSELPYIEENKQSLQALSGPMRLSTEDIDFPETDEISVYEVKKGDTIAEVAELFDVSVNTIMWANDLKSRTLTPGSVLVILPVTGIKHTVKKGDTIKALAKKYKADAEDIAKYNGIVIEGSLAIGDTVIIPDGEITITQPKTTPKNGKPKILNSYSYVAPGGFLTRPLVGGRRTQGIHGHNGVDIAATPGTPVLASASGRVISARVGGYNGGYGNMVIISHDNGIQTVYGHLREVNVSSGETVVQGQVIGGVGNTGRSTGPHLHFEVRGAKNPF